MSIDWEKNWGGGGMQINVYVCKWELKTNSTQWKIHTNIAKDPGECNRFPSDARLCVCEVCAATSESRIKQSVSEYCGISSFPNKLVSDLFRFVTIFSCIFRNGNGRPTNRPKVEMKNDMGVHTQEYYHLEIEYFTSCISRPKLGQSFIYTW